MSKVKVAILGCGGMAGGHAKRFAAHPDAEVVALCDVSEAVVNRFIAKNIPDYEPAPQIFTDAAQMYAQAKPDALVIVTPHTLHFEHGLQALAAGCHVLMEKPMVTDSQQAHQLAQAVADAGRIFVIGYNTPCHPNFQYVRQAIRSGELGKLQTVTGWQTQNWMKGTTGSWRQNPELSGGGQMYDSGAHMFNSLVWSVEQPVSEVLAFIDNQSAPVDINGTVNVRFANGVLATMTISGNCANGGAGMYYAFENGRIDVDGWNATWIKVFRGKEGEVTNYRTESGEMKPLIEGEKQAPGDNFMDAILGRAAPMTTPLNGVQQSELMDAIYESAQTGQIARPKRA